MDEWMNGWVDGWMDRWMLPILVLSWIVKVEAARSLHAGF